MFWRRNKSIWPIDPSRVQLGSVVERGRNLSRTHVRVKYRRATQAQFVPLVDFVLRCRKALQVDASLGIDHLLVAPIIKQRHTEFFEQLTDWRPATRSALASRPGHPRRELEDEQR